MTELQQGRIARLTVALVAMLAYLPALRTGFVSEDFFILRILSDLGPAEGLWQHLTGPWLDLQIVAFYRPLSTLILHLETLAFGTWHTGYIVVHVLAHGLATWLVAHLLERLTSPANGSSNGGPSFLLPSLAALLFGIFPLHPNTVTFVASFATLFSAIFLLAGLCLLIPAEISNRRALAGMSAVLAACLSYEQAVVAPVLLGAVWWLGLGGPESKNHRGRLTAIAIGVTVGFFLVRQWALRSGLGGYRETQEQLLGLEPGVLLAALSYLARIFLWPTYPNLLPPWSGFLVVALTGLCASAGMLRGSRETGGSRELRSVALGAVWFVVCMLPFGFPAVVPANGRYLYMASIGGVIVLVGVCQWFIRQGRSPRRSVAAIAVLLVLAMGWHVLLQAQIQTQVTASLEAKLLRDAVLEEGPEGPLAILGTPDFVRDGAPQAQIFHWGLSDALLPPFAQGRAVYPVHSLAPQAVMAAQRDGWLRVKRWQNQRIVDPADKAVPICIDTNPISGGAALELLNPELLQGALRLITLTPQSEIVTAVATGATEVQLHADAQVTYQKLFPSLPTLSWLELREPGLAGQRPRLCTSKVYPSHRHVQ